MSGAVKTVHSHKRTFEHPTTSTGAIPLACYDSSWGCLVSEEGVERRLTTILAADVLGCSRLMAADEAGTVVALRSHRVHDVREAHVGRGGEER